MDTSLVWRNAMYEPERQNWKPKTTGIHCDQNPFWKTGRQCIQGMIPYFHVNKQIGGLALVPGSATDDCQEQLRQRYPEKQKNKSDWLKLAEDDSFQGQERLVKLEPGDLLLWDSRTIHGGVVGPGYSEEHPPVTPCDFARLSLTICMTPKKWASDKMLIKRRNWFEKGYPLNHWPHDSKVNMIMGYPNSTNMPYRP